jgi:hypothetical protein
MRRLLTLSAASFAAVFACGGSPPPTHDVTSLPSASASASAAPSVDLSPVAMPASVVVLIHAAHIGATADVMADWAGQPLPIEEPLAEMVGERIAKLVDTDTAADMVITAEDRGGRREPEIHISVALNVKGFDAAKAALQTDYGLLPLTNGAFAISRAGTRHRDGDSDFRACALAPSPDGAGRIICTRDPTERDAVMPFLTRGVASLKNLKNDVHVDARPGPFREMVRRERASITQAGSRFMGGGRAMRGVWESGLADLCDSFLDVDRATFDATIDPKTGSAELKITAKGAHGSITRLLTGHPDHADTAPAMFLKLPGDADVALYAHGPDVTEIQTAKTQMLLGLAAALDSEPAFKDADKKAFADAASHTFDLLPAPVVVYARGVDIAKALPAVSGLTETSDASKIKSGLEQAAGWDVIGIEAAPDKVTAVLKEWTAFVARPAVIASMQGDSTPLWKVAGAARNAPAGTVHITLTQSHEDVDYAPPPPGVKPKKRPPIVLTLHTLVVPDQTRVWIVNALDEATASAKARALVAGGSGTLAAREGLDVLKTAHTNAGGFVTPRGLGLGVPLSWLFTWNPRYKAANDPLMGISSQSQYTTPLVFTAAESAAGGESTLSLGLRIPRPALQDVMQVGPRIFR